MLQEEHRVIGRAQRWAKMFVKKQEQFSGTVSHDQYTAGYNGCASGNCRF
jgi:hypothetical protein